MMALTGVLVLWLPVLWLNLTVALFAALITYAATRGLAAWLRHRWPALKWGEPWALVLILAVLVAIMALTGDHLADQAGNYTVARLMQYMAGLLERLQTSLPASLGQHLPASAYALQDMGAQALRSHAMQVQQVGLHTVRNVGHALAGLVIGAIAALQLAPRLHSKSPPLVQRLRHHFDELMAGFSQIFFAQLRIAALNTALTAFYLWVLLPLFAKPLPMSGTLVVLTFVAGLVPVVGNLISNSAVVVVSLSDSIGITLMSLAWLVGIHKLEYFLNAQIIGHKIHARAWELLVAMLVMEAAFGIAGLVSAPIIYAQAKRILKQHGWL